MTTHDAELHNLIVCKRDAKGAGRNGAMHSRLEPVPTDCLTQKGPALGRASRVAQQAPELRSTAALIGIALSLDGSGRFVGHPHRQLGDALVGVDHLLQAVARQIALNGHEVLHRAGGG